MSYRALAVDLRTGETVCGVVQAESLRAAEDVAEAKALLFLRATPGEVLVTRLNEVAGPLVRNDEGRAA